MECLVLKYRVSTLGVIPGCHTKTICEPISCEALDEKKPMSWNGSRMGRGWLTPFTRVSCHADASQSCRSSRWSCLALRGPRPGPQWWFAHGEGPRPGPHPLWGLTWWRCPPFSQVLFSKSRGLRYFWIKMILIQTRSQIYDGYILAVKRKRFCVTFILVNDLSFDFKLIFYILYSIWMLDMHDYIPRTRVQDYLTWQSRVPPIDSRGCTLKFVYSCSWGSFWVDPARKSVSINWSLPTRTNRSEIHAIHAPKLWENGVVAKLQAHLVVTRLEVMWLIWCRGAEVPGIFFSPNVNLKKWGKGGHHCKPVTAMQNSTYSRQNGHENIQIEHYWSTGSRIPTIFKQKSAVMWWKLPKAMSDVLLNMSFVQRPRGDRTAIKTPQVANEAKHQRHNAILQTQKFHKCPWLQLVKALCRRSQTSRSPRWRPQLLWRCSEMDGHHWMAISRWSFIVFAGGTWVKSCDCVVFAAARLKLWHQAPSRQ